MSQFLSILTMVAPVILMAVPGGAAMAPLVPLIIKGISDAQAQPHATNADKKAYVLFLVNDAVVTTNIVKPGTLDRALVNSAVSQGIDAVIATMNVIQAAHDATVVPVK